MRVRYSHFEPRRIFDFVIVLIRTMYLLLYLFGFILMMYTVYASQKWSRVTARLQMVVQLRYIKTREFVNNKTLHV